MFTPEESAVNKAEELNFQIEAIKLNKIDEESLEESSSWSSEP